MRKPILLLCALGLLATPALAVEQVYPSGAHAAFNYIPFGTGPTGVMHQVFASTLFSSQTGGLPAEITKLAFAPNNGSAGQTFQIPVKVRLGYTTRIPGQASPTGLSAPAAGGGGAPNAVGAMSMFYDNAAYSYTVVSGGPNNFEMQFTGTPFIYNPAQGNLLLEIVADGVLQALSVSRTAGNAEASRAYTGPVYNGESPTTASRIQFTYTAVPEPATLALAGLLLVLRRR